MGSYVSKVIGNRIKKILILGHEGTGKTTIFRILNKKYNNKPRKTDDIQSGGFNVDIIKDIVIWDLSGKRTMIPFWSCYFNNVDGIIWVIDATSKKNNDALEMMYGLLTSIDLYKAKVLVYVHKSDLVEDLVTTKLKEKIDLMFPTRNIKILSSTIKNHQQIYEGYDWIVEAMTSSKTRRYYFLPF